MSVLIIRCSCEHAYQDKKYGHHMRAHNQTRKNDGQTYRCTVCGELKYVPRKQTKKGEYSG